VAAVRLEGTLRHWVRLLLNLVESCNGNSLSVYRGFEATAKSGWRAPWRRVDLGAGRPNSRRRRAFFTRNGATKFLSLDRLNQARFSVLLSNPLPKVDFYLFVDRTLAGMVVSLRDGVFGPARRPPANSVPLTSPFPAVQEFCCRYSRFRSSDLRVGLLV